MISEAIRHFSWVLEQGCPRVLCYHLEAPVVSRGKGFNPRL